jgi:probable rRNA maturation factor
MSKIKPVVRLHLLMRFTLTSREALKSYIISRFKKEKIPFESLDIIFCDDEHLLQLNRQFLKHDYYTDILSFPLSGAGLPLVAEIYISIDRVRDNAKNLDSSFTMELHRVIFHGVLHFCGYKDKSRLEIRKMRDLEEQWLQAYKKRITVSVL